MHAIVTGATGFVGSYLVKELLKDGYKVTAVVRPGSENLERLSGLVGADIKECMLDSFERLPSLINEQCDYFYHMAWQGVSGPDQTNYKIQMLNIEAAISAVNAAEALGCKRFIGAGSVHETECKNEMQKPCKVENPSNAYKIAKLAAHYYCKLTSAKTKMDFIWPLLTNAYGPGEKSPRLINTVIRTLQSGGEPALTPANQLYDFVYVTDAARAYRLIGERGVGYENYIIGSGVVKPLKEYLLALRDIVYPGALLGFGKHEYNGVYLEEHALFNGNLKRDTGFAPQISFEEGIRKTSEWLVIQENMSDLGFTRETKKKSD